MFTSIADFKTRWEFESKNTQAVMDALTDSSLAQSVADGHRSLGRMAWHIVMTLPEMMAYAGLEFSGINVDAPVPDTAKQIADTYRKVSSDLLNKVSAEWNDTTLQHEDDFYGEKWKRGLSLFIVVLHEVHHRGQMTVLMRQAGLTVPSIYGPAKEGWAAMGAPIPEV